MKKKYLFILAATALIIVFCLFVFYYFLPKPALSSSALVKGTASRAEKAWVSGKQLDFRKLQSLNGDVSAWLYIPGTEINAPILQSTDQDDYFYLTHSLDRTEGGSTCLITQASCNATDFSDPVTVIYGGRANSAFSSLERLYTQQGSLSDYSEIAIFTPGQLLVYHVFGYSAYSRNHILSSYGSFSDRSRILDFIGSVQTYRSLLQDFDSSITVSEDDRLLVLSTALGQDQEQRFIVLAKLVDSAN